MRDSAGRVLNVRKRGTKKYMLPGGKPEPGETAADTALREFHEELGVQLNPTLLRSLGTFYTEAANEARHTLVADVFEHPEVAGVTASSEIDSVKWISPHTTRTDLAPLTTAHIFPALRDKSQTASASPQLLETSELWPEQEADRLTTMQSDAKFDSAPDTQTGTGANTPTTAEIMTTGTIQRTKNAIIQAALEILPQNANASLNEIAEQAGVGRSTLHRHFSDREEVLFTLAQHIRRLTLDAIERAAPSFGTPQEALRRTVNELIDLGPALIWMNDVMRSYNDQQLTEEIYRELESFRDLLDRAQVGAHGLPNEWRSRVFWEVLRLGPEYFDRSSRQQIIEYIMLTLTHGIVAE